MQMISSVQGLETKYFGLQLKEEITHLKAEIKKLNENVGPKMEVAETLLVDAIGAKRACYLS